MATLKPLSSRHPLKPRTWKCLLFLVLLVATSRAAERDAVAELHDNDFHDFLKREPSVLVMFFAPWCHWCQELLPRFGEAARILDTQNIPVRLATVDATKERRLADEHDVSHFPTVKFFLDGEAHDYEGGRFTTQIVKWVTERLETELHVHTMEQLATLKASHRGELLLIADMRNSKGTAMAEAYHKASRHFEHILFVNTSSDEVLDDIRKLSSNVALSPPYLALESPHDGDLPVVLLTGQATEERLKEFVMTYKFPMFTSFDNAVAAGIFADGRPVLALFSLPSSANVEKFKTAMLPVAAKYRSRLLTIHAGSGSVFDNRLATMSAVDNDEIERSTIRLFTVNPSGHGTWYSTVKYKPSEAVLSNPSASGVDDFVAAFFAKKLKPWLRSEPIPDPEDNKGPVYTVVANSFDEEVRQTKRDVLVEFYAPWCGHCRTLEKDMQLLGRYLEGGGISNKVRVAKIDATQNEVDVLIVGYPTLILYPGNDKGNPVFYRGDRTADALLRFIADKGSNRFDAAAVKARYEASRHQQKAAPNSFLLEEL